ncbi:hypothetical protein ACFQGT_09710 [Natrialbaceae archaeon GCM10025810]|uniref:hypothetical protein n=1 Tax=Halovalidus salilacus TaxID=3075124 RepID=UPI003605BC3D
MSTFTIKQGDTSPALEATLRDGSGLPIDLTDATVELRVRDEHGEVHINSSAFVEPEEDGVVVYEWKPEDTARPGIFRGEWHVTFEDGSVETFPNSGYLSIYVVDGIGV